MRAGRMGRSVCSNIAKAVQLMARSSAAGRGEWGNSPWNGGWEGGRREEQPEMTAAVQHLREAQRNLESASHDKGGHRERAIQLVNQAITEVDLGIQYDNTH